MNLVTLAEYKAYVGITTNNQDAAIENVIPGVSALVKSICRRSLVDYVDDAKVEVHSGGYGHAIFLKEYPVLAVSGVELSTDYGANYTDLIEFEDYVLDQECGTLTSLKPGGFPKRLNGYKVTYTAGYETLPGDLKLAVMDTISYYLKNDAVSHASKGSNSGTLQVEYITNINLPAHIMRVLNLYVGSVD